MLFSIVIPTYNRKYTISNTIESLMNQIFDDFEIIVIDDGSTDGTGDYITGLNNPKIRYYYKENGGKHTALNLGIQNAKGELVLILDSDDQLLPLALKEMASIWGEIKNDNRICGIMGRCSENGELIGDLFEDSPIIMSYLDFHFADAKKNYRDCCECIRTDIINKYLWPEDENTKFVPESFITDQIGISYNLYCVNTIWEKKQYLRDGITNNSVRHMEKNCVGYLYDTISKIDDIFPKYRVSVRTKCAIWWKYWNLVRCDKGEKGKRIKSISPLGYCIMVLTPLINLYKKVK